MTCAISARDLGKKYGKKWALQNCTFDLQQGRIAGLVGPNGACKTTLMNILVGLLRPSAGTIRVYGMDPQESAQKYLPLIGFVSQEKPLYRQMTVADMLKFGRKTNQRWDQSIAEYRLQELDIPMQQKIGELSGGQQAHFALLLAISKQPSLLVLDEPFANLDPLARQTYKHILLDFASYEQNSVLISSHHISDLEQLCDSLVLLSRSHLILADDIECLMEAHRWVTCSPEEAEAVGQRYQVLKTVNRTYPARLLIRLKDLKDHFGLNPLTTEAVTLEDLVLAYLETKPAAGNTEPLLKGKEGV